MPQGYGHRWRRLLPASAILDVVASGQPTPAERAVHDAVTHDGPAGTVRAAVPPPQSGEGAGTRDDHRVDPATAPNGRSARAVLAPDAAARLRDVVRRLPAAARGLPDAALTAVRRLPDAALTAVRRLPDATLTAARTWPPSAVRATACAARATRDWSRRPTGRFVLPGLLMAVLVIVATVSGGYLVPRTASDSRAGTPPAGGVGPGGTPTAGAAAPAPTGPGVPEVDPTGTLSAGKQVGDTLAAWAAPLSGKTGIPAKALQAYAFAEVVLAQTRPTCNLRWTTLAGIGLVESNHGRGGDATLGADGRAAPPIYGPPLDGQGGRRSIPDTDAGRLDGDRTWDRAIGPMQFIPGTWVRYAVDADADGLADPHDLDDAALAAANYLCAGGRDLSTPAGWWAAVLAYNDVQTYAQSVFTAANDYGQRSRT